MTSSPTQTRGVRTPAVVIAEREAVGQTTMAGGGDGAVRRPTATTASHERRGKGRFFAALTSAPGNPLPLTPPSLRAPRWRPDSGRAGPQPKRRQTTDGVPHALPDVREVER